MLECRKIVCGIAEGISYFKLKSIIAHKFIIRANYVKNGYHPKMDKPCRNGILEELHRCSKKTPRPIILETVTT